MIYRKDIEQEMYRPAIEGTIGILKSIKDKAPSVKRVVVTSSFATVADRSKGFRPGYVYTDKDWNPVSSTPTAKQSGTHDLTL
jgi:nucleoside-diphosphate-sugar epimerase